MKISEVLAAKASQATITIAHDATVRELLAVLAENNIGAAVVSADGNLVDGIVTERDVVRKLHRDETVLGSTVATIMTSPVKT